MPVTSLARALKPWGGNRTGPRPKPDAHDILDTIFDEVSKGTPLNHAAVLAGIHEDTAYTWEQLGEDQLRDNPGLSLEELGSHAVFAWILKQARAVFVSDTLDEWRGAEKDWAKWATLAERRDRANFGKQDSASAQVTIGTLNMVAVTAQLDQPTLSKLLGLVQSELLRLAPPADPTQ